jgi:hypothetical protein
MSRMQIRVYLIDVGVDHTYQSALPDPTSSHHRIHYLTISPEKGVARVRMCVMHGDKD